MCLGVLNKSILKIGFNWNGNVFMDLLLYSTQSFIYYNRFSGGHRVNCVNITVIIVVNINFLISFAKKTKHFF